MLVCLMKAGTPASEAIKRAGLAITESAARKILRRFEKQGLAGLIDHRLGNKKKKTLLTDDMKKRILAWWFARLGRAESLRACCAKWLSTRLRGAQGPGVLS